MNISLHCIPRQARQDTERIRTWLKTMSATHMVEPEIDISRTGELAKMREKVQDPKARAPLLYSETYGCLGVS